MQEVVEGTLRVEFGDDTEVGEVRRRGDELHEVCRVKCGREEAKKVTRYNQMK